jgi:hypothetical protein
MDTRLRACLLVTGTVLSIVLFSIYLTKDDNTKPTNNDKPNNVIWDSNLDNYTFNYDKILFGSYTLLPTTTEIIMKVDFPENSCATCNVKGGVGFYGNPNKIFPRHEITFEYQIYFDPNFEFVKGGKLPGIYGGKKGADGGNYLNDGFSIRLMWRTNGTGELYTYLPHDQSQEFYNMARTREIYGSSLGFNTFTFTRGIWHTVKINYRLNSINNTVNYDGSLKLWFDSVPVFQFDKLNYRNTTKTKLNGIFFNTFFGGNDTSWASEIDTYILFKNFRLY